MPRPATKNTFYSREEVEKHNKDGDLWLIIDCLVYDVSSWIQKHPGGEKVLRSLAGKDCSEVFRTFHNPKIAQNILPAFRIGQTYELKDGKAAEKTEISKDFELLRKTLEEEGAFKPNYWFYFFHGLFILSIFLGAIYLASNSNGYMCTVAAAVLMGFFWQQMAFIGHDIGHHSVTQGTKSDDLLGIIIGNFLTGISVAWWRDNHNYHHVVTNSFNYDPDIQHLPVFAVSKKFFKTFFSEYYKREFKMDSVAQMLVPYQHMLFYPVMAIARFNLYAQSLIFISTAKQIQRRSLEIFMLFLFWVWLLNLCSSLPSWSHSVVFLFLSHAVAGIIHVQICLSHFSMPVFDGLPQESHEKDGYVISQFEATTNIKCLPMFDIFHGGLQFQTEHHLFPRVSRSHLRGLQNRVKPLCKKHGIPYHEMGFFEANCAVLKTLKDTAKQASCFSSFFVDGLNAVG